MTATKAEIDREAIAAIALRRCGAWCRKRSGGDPRWRQRFDPDWEMVASLAALRVAMHFRPRDDADSPHGNFINRCCSSALSDLTRTARRRIASGGFDASLSPRVPLSHDITRVAASEPWIESAINEEAARV